MPGRTCVPSGRYHVSMRLSFPIDPDALRAFCGRWRIREFSLFGSVATGAFGPDSDVDVLVAFEPDDPWTLLDLATMKLELEALFGRRVDLVEEGAVRNPYRRASILRDKRTLYAA